jgi:hypothetical protein
VTSRRRIIGIPFRSAASSNRWHASSARGPRGGHGPGAATLDAVVDYLGTRPGAEVLYTSCADGPRSPRGFYLRYGFTDTGRVLWGENVLALNLAAGDIRARRHR